MGVPINDPKVPPFEMVNVPPCISSMDILPYLPFLARSAIPYGLKNNVLALARGTLSSDSFLKQEP